MEAQGVRCKVRESESYPTVVDEVTGGVAALDGKHEDETVKYVVSESAVNAAAAAIAANREAQLARDFRTLHFWKSNEPEW